MHHHKFNDFPNGFPLGRRLRRLSGGRGLEREGKGPSVWDSFTKLPGKTFEGSNGDVAVDHYHRVEEDVALMAEMGLKAYRFSVSWPRIYPTGRGEVNEAGLAFYDRLIDALLAHGIEPVLTLYHWDLPQALQDEYGGWEDRRIIDDFERYCVTLYQRFAGKVKYWVSLNEQNYNLTNAYQLGTHPPAVQDRKRFFAANHIAFLANARVIKAFRQHVPNGLIGPSFAYSPPIRPPAPRATCWRSRMPRSSPTSGGWMPTASAVTPRRRSPICGRPARRRRSCRAISSSCAKAPPTTSGSTTTTP
jgi:6-phospho-beta-glucosidase